MQKSTRDAFIALPLAFGGMIYILNSMISFDHTATAIQWLAGFGGVFVCLLFMYQIVRGLMHDLSKTP